MASALLGLLLVGAAVGTPVEELFAVPGFDPQGQKDVFDKCLSDSTANFTKTHGDTGECPKSCLGCVEDAKYCPFQCRFQEACGCYLELGDLVTAYEKCCDMFDIGMIRAAPQCKSRLDQMTAKVLRTFEYHCGKTTTTVEPGTCATDTGGSCAWFPCDSSRHSVCDTQTYRCVCDEHSCASGGGCSASKARQCSAHPECEKEGLTGECCPSSKGHMLDCCSKDSEAMDNVASFTALIEEIKLAARVQTFAPELSAHVEMTKDVDSDLAFGKAFSMVACAAIVTAAVLGAVKSFRTQQAPLLIDEALG